MKRLTVFIAIVVFFISTTAFAEIDDAQQAVQALSMAKQMSQTTPVVLNPEAKKQIDTVYLEVINGSTVGLNVDAVKKELVDRFTSGGYKVVENPAEAGYVVQISIGKLTVYQEKSSSGLLSGIGSTLGGLFGLAAGVATGSTAGMEIGSKVGSAVGGAAGEVTETVALEAMLGKKFSYLGIADVNVVENFQEQKKEYKGNYPIAGKGKNITVDEFSSQVGKGLGDLLVGSSFKK